MTRTLNEVLTTPPPQTLPFIAIKLRGGKDEEWALSLGGNLLINELTFGAKDQAESYAQILNWEYSDGHFDPYR